MLCEKACSSKTGVGEGDDGIVLLYSNHQKTFTLKEFEEMQSKQTHEAKEKLAVLRVKVLTFVKEACEVGGPLRFSSWPESQIVCSVGKNLAVY